MPVDIDGVAAVRVQLFGKGSDGRSMLLDAKDWQTIARRWGRQWVLYGNSRGFIYVGSGRRAPASQAKQAGRAPTAILARIIKRVRPGAVVTYRNGDRLDLRRANLEVTTRRRLARRRATAAASSGR